MPLNQKENTTDYHWPILSKDDDPSVLTSIYDDQFNIAIWQRQHNTVLDSYAKTWAERCSSHAPRLIVSVDKATEQITTLLPDLDHKSEFQQEIALLVDMFAYLFDTAEVGLRLPPLEKAMCPRFHVDNIPCRLVCTYGGLGTEWLQEENIDRTRLGRGANGLSDSESGIYHDEQTIQRLDSQHVALLKGSGWQGNEDYGLVHRSPHLQQGQTRLLLTLDFS